MGHAVSRKGPSAWARATKANSLRTPHWRRRTCFCRVTQQLLQQARPMPLCPLRPAAGARHPPGASVASSCVGPAATSPGCGAQVATCSASRPATAGARPVSPSSGGRYCTANCGRGVRQSEAGG